MKLTCSNGTEKFHYEIQDDCLLVNSSNLTQSSRKEVPFEHIGYRKQYTERNILPLLIIGILVLIIGVILFFTLTLSKEPMVKDDEIFARYILPPFFFIGGIVAIFMFIRGKSCEYKISANDGFLCFPYRTNQVEEVESFIENLLIKRNEHLFSKYLKKSEHLSREDQTGLFQWMLDEKIIGEDKYNDIQLKLKDGTLYKDKSNQIGFTKR